MYIDASHFYQDVKEDVRLAYDHVKPGGVVGGHDFTAHYDGVVRAVLEFSDDNDLLLQGNNNDWWFVK